VQDDRGGLALRGPQARLPLDRGVRAPASAAPPGREVRASARSRRPEGGRSLNEGGVEQYGVDGVTFDLSQDAIQADPSHVSAAMGTSLYPTRAMSLPTRRPASRIAPMAPKAVKSLTAKMADGGGSSAIIFSVARRPLATSKPEVTIWSTGMSTPAWENAMTNPLVLSAPVLVSGSPAMTATRS